MKYYEFVDRAASAKIGGVVVVEGTERVLADRVLSALEERLLPPTERLLNCDRFVATEPDALRAIDAAAAALPFLGTTRVVIVRRAHELRAEARRALVSIAERLPAGNVLIIEDLIATSSKRPEPIGKLLGRGTTRIDTTAGPPVRERFIVETLSAFGATADAGALALLVANDADLAAVATDLAKLALGGATITAEDVLREAPASAELRAYKFAAAAVSGRTGDALEVAADFFATDPRGAAVPLLAALAAEYLLVWETARGTLPARARWRERELRAAVRVVGERRARIGFERAIRGFEHVVTGRADDPRLVLEIATIAGAPSKQD